MSVTLNSFRANELLSVIHLKESWDVQDFDSSKFSDFQVWAKVETENGIVKKLSLKTSDPLHYKILFEVVARLSLGKPLLYITSLSLRECEAFLRDKNSVPALLGLGSQDEIIFNQVTKWLGHLKDKKPGLFYQFKALNFKGMKLAEKIREMKEFLAGQQVTEIYESTSLPELLDVEDLTIYLQVSFETDQDKERLEKLHWLAVETFHEPELNLIPET